MRSRPRRFRVSSCLRDALVVVCAGAGLALVACGGDDAGGGSADGSTGVDAGYDDGGALDAAAGTDAGSDGSTGSDSGDDGSSEDAAGDASDASDANTTDDGGTDAATDASTDGGNDAGSDAGATAVCGDGVLTPPEQCDDHNVKSGDGCSATCTGEKGWNCTTPGSPCTRVEFCGDGVVNADHDETCDDGNTTSGDGCSAICTLEPNFVCNTPGQPCTSTVKCGDGKIAGNETCDDGNARSGDGCSATCQTETGWKCPAPAQQCVARSCGDGILAGGEQCDDGNKGSGDGCSATCTIEPGHACVTQGTPPHSVCHTTTCGDGVKEGFEACDDGNRIPYDGCSATCTIEPRCQGGSCTPTCGDGIKHPSEPCDDGNLVGGDGCSATCTIERGFSCPATNQPPQPSLVVPILYRDMLYAGTTVPGPGHPDFNEFSGSGAQTGLVQATLGSDSEPAWKSNTAANTGSTQLTGAVDFCWWFHERGCNGAGSVNPYDKLVALDAQGRPTVLTMTAIATNSYQYASSSFLPINGLGWNATANPQVTPACAGPTSNYSFTTELHVPFTYHATTSPTVSFTVDDDGWIFIGGNLAVDLGGTHPPASGSVTLDSTTAARLRLGEGGTYTIDVFQAERSTCGSTYNLTLTGFTHTVSTCTAICGDGIVAGNEVCDDGKNNGSYGSCAPGCGSRSGYCGDATTQSPPEQCDDGTNASTYGATNSKACDPVCTYAPYCGDAIVSNGEQCDEGGSNGAGYGHCTARCRLGPRCGDAVLQTANGEQCDDGVDNGSTNDTCSASCKLK